MPRDSDSITAEEAARLWRRAAQLQAEAALTADALAEEQPEGESGPPGEDGYALAHVRSAALEVGIGEEFVDVALADLRAEQALPAVPEGKSLARRFLRDPPDTLVSRRMIAASATDVLSAMEAVFPREPYRLTLTDQQGDPFDGGVLVFDIPGTGSPFPQGFALEARYGGMRQLFVSIREIEGEAPSSEVTVRSPVTWSHRSDFVTGSFLSGLAGAGGLGLGLVWLAIISGLSGPTGLGPIAIALATSVIAGGAVGGTALGARIYRKNYRKSIDRGRTALDGLLGAVAARAQGGWGATLSDESDPKRELLRGFGLSD